MTSISRLAALILLAAIAFATLSPIQMRPHLGDADRPGLCPVRPCPGLRIPRPPGAGNAVCLHRGRRIGTAPGDRSRPTCPSPRCPGQSGGRLDGDCRRTNCPCRCRQGRAPTIQTTAIVVQAQRFRARQRLTFGDVGRAAPAVLPALAAIPTLTRQRQHHLGPTETSLRRTFEFQQIVRAARSNSRKSV